MDAARATVAFIGSGNMAEALITALRAGPRHDCALVVTDVDPHKAMGVAQRHGGMVAACNRDAVKDADWVVLCTKPGAITAVAGEIGSHTRPNACIVSVAAGVETVQIESALTLKRPVLRIMSNLPVAIGEGIIAVSRGTHATDEHTHGWSQMFADAGTVSVVDERTLDAVTALAGSGPAFVLLFIEALADAATREGIDAGVALRFATQTVLGAARWQQSSGETPAALRKRVTSPAGTTERGLHVLEQGGLRAIVQDTISAATARAKELAHSSRT